LSTLVAQAPPESELLGLLDLLGPDGPAVISSSVVRSRTELFLEAANLADQIAGTVAEGDRVGLVDAGDHLSIVAVIACLLAQRPIAMLPVTGNDVSQVTAARARCGVVLRGGALSQIGSPARDRRLDSRYGLHDGDSAEVLVLFTSGTTNEPRGVRLSAGNLAANLTAMRRTAAAWTASERIGQILPVTHSFGLSMALLALIARSPLVLLDGGPPSRRLLQSLDDHHVSILGCVPYYLRLLARRGLDVGIDCATQLRALYLAGGGISDIDLHATLPFYEGDVYLMYGFTEATARVAVRRRGDGAPRNSVGLPLPGTHVEILDENGAVVPAGTGGRIRVSSPCLMIGYLGEPPREPGSPWPTTDLGRLDTAGNLFITGRVAEMLNFRGNRLSVVTIEAEVIKLSGVQDARLIPDSREEDAQCRLQIVPEAHVDHRNLRAELMRTVNPKGLLREITFVDHLEMTRSGKPLRRS
jgi:acyl-coenzyme A synthetase/AMP-(fatty) acid ligase